MSRTYVYVIVGVFIGWFIGLYFANWFWKDSRNFYLEAKHQYEYCPFCGEYIGED